MLDIARRIEGLIRDAVEDEGFEVVGVELAQTGRSPVLRVYVDRPGGVTVSDCAYVSRRVGVLLEVDDFIPGSYTLEVSSPGLERPLFSEADYRRFQGREIRLQAVEKIEGRRNFSGRIKAFSNGIVQLDCEGEIFSVPLDRVKKANLVYRFD
jgi:ribosome maturation factor RimP